MIGAVGNQHEAVIRISKVKGKAIHLLSLSPFLTVSRYLKQTFTALHKATIQHYFSVKINAGDLNWTKNLQYFQNERQEGLKESDSYYIASSPVRHSDFVDFHDLPIGLD